MAGLPDDPTLKEIARRLADMRWSAMLLDQNLRVVFVSDEFRGFIGVDDDDVLGYGENVITAFMRDVWRDRIELESQMRLFSDVMPYFLYMLPPEEKHALDDLVEPFSSLIDQIEPQAPGGLVNTWFLYTLGGRPKYRVNLAAMPLADASWEPLGFLVLTYVDVRPQLASLLTQGNEDMYERMAALVEPGRRRAAVLFTDVESSGALSRQMPSAAYFSLMQRLAVSIDRVIADNSGIIGKHAGDGMTGFFLVDDLGSASAAVAAAIRSAQEIKEVGGAAFEEVVAELGVPQDVTFAMNTGLHWGGTLYMGQLHPGGRLEVTALGDEMNECARIQESARHGAILASKALLEHLTDKDAGDVGIDPDRQLYQPLGELNTASDKAKRDAGGLPVTEL